MDKGNTGMLRGTSVFMGLSHNIKGACFAALVIFLSGLGPAVYAQESTLGENETIPSDAEITSPRASTEALMDAYNKKIQRVMDQADPFSSKEPEVAYSAAEALKSNKEYTKALELYLKLAGQTSDPDAFSGAAEAAQGAGLNEKAIELADEALARYEKQYEAMLTKAKAYKNLDQIPEARIMIEKAMETMGEDGSGIDAAVMDLYKEIMLKTSGNPDVETP